MTRRVSAGRRAALLAAAFLAARPAPRAFAHDASGEAVEFFEQSAQVITAERRRESARESPAAVDVVTAEDIRASGAVNLWDLLRFRAGLDVEDAANDGLAIVSIRGFARTTVRQLLVLIDGRSVISPTRSAVDWEQLPVQLQDIERIEIVRGPNAALYGSNAGFGVVNIITKSPGAGVSAAAGASAGSAGLWRSEGAVEGSAGRLRFRASQTRTTRDGTSLEGGGAAGDFLFSNKQNFRGILDLGSGGSLDLLAGGSWDTTGAFAAPPASARQNRYRSHFELARLTRAWGPGELELTGARNENQESQELDVGLRALRELQYDAEGLYRWGWLGDRLHSVVGTSYRLALAQSDQLFARDPKQQNRVARAFAGQTAVLAPVTLSAGVSLEHSDTSGYEPAWQAAALWALSEDHALRFSYAYAPTLPSLFDEHANSLDSSTRKRVGNPGLDSDHLLSYELGWRGSFFGRLGAEVNAFYLDHRDLNESFTVSKVGKLTTASVNNGDRALARGAEAILRLALEGGRQAWAAYTFEHVTDAVGNLAVTAGVPEHAFNLGARAPLGRGFSAQAVAGYKDAYAAGPDAVFYAVPAYWRLDARLAYSPRPGVELFLAGQNLAQAFHSKEFVRSAPIARTYQGGVALRWP